MTDELKNVPGHDSADDQSRQAQARPDPDAEKSDKGKQTMVPKARLDEVIGQRKAAEAALTEVLEDLVQDVPEDRRDLIPELPAAERIKWIRKALRAGVFGGNQAPNGPDPKRPGGKPALDLANMTPHEMRAAGYKS